MKRTTFKDGTVMDVAGTVRTQYNPNGSAVRTDSKDAVVKSRSIVSSGTRIAKYANGDTLQRNPDGTTIRKSKRTGTWGGAVGARACSLSLSCATLTPVSRLPPSPPPPSLRPRLCVAGARTQITPDCTRVEIKANGASFTFKVDGTIVEKMPAGGAVQQVRPARPPLSAAAS
jgi:hypothetical protein